MYRCRLCRRAARLGALIQEWKFRCKTHEHATVLTNVLCCGLDRFDCHLFCLAFRKQTQQHDGIKKDESVLTCSVYDLEKRDHRMIVHLQGLSDDTVHQRSC